MSKNIVILGAGYGGVLTALTARKYLTEDEAKITGTGLTVTIPYGTFNNCIKKRNWEALGVRCK